MSYKTTQARLNKTFVGRKVVEVTGSEDCVTLTLEGGDLHYIRLEGDCCSVSYFTDWKQFEELVGSTIQTVEERYKGREDDADMKAESVAWHFLVFVTNKGHVTIDWRNDSNGYYDGTIMLDGRW
jgi:hypothetical protein